MNTAKRQPLIDSRAYRANVRRWQAMMTDLSKKSGLPRDQVVDLCRQQIATITGGDSSSKALNDKGWGRLFNFLNDRLALVDPQRPSPRICPGRRNKDALSTDKQRKVINTLRELLGWSEADFASFCRQRLGIPSPATRDWASKVIDGLKPQALREHQVQDRIQRALEIPHLHPPDRAILKDVACQFAGGKQGANVAVGSIPIILRILSRYKVGKEDNG